MTASGQAGAVLLCDISILQTLFPLSLAAIPPAALLPLSCSN